MSSLRYSDEDIRRLLPQSNSMAHLLSLLGLRNAGGNYDNMRRTLQRLGLTCSHWNGQGWSKDKQLKDWSQYKKGNSLKPHLIKDRGYRCERCLLTEWLGHPITLEIEHKDGDRTNNDINNLELLCCNCHSLTPTWKGRNVKRIPKPKIAKHCIGCGIEFSRRGKFCTSKCYHKYSRPKRSRKTKITWPDKANLLLLVESVGFRAAGKSLGVSDNAIRKHLRKEGIFSPVLKEST